MLGVHVLSLQTNHFVMEVMLKQINSQLFSKQKKMEICIYVVANNQQMHHIVMVHT